MADVPIEKLKLMITVVDRGQGEGLSEKLRQAGCYLNFVLLGDGTADTALMDMLGLSEKRKDVVITLMRASRAREILGMVDRALELNTPGNGIAFTIPFSSVGGQKTYQLLVNLRAGSAGGK